jgi:hypothetical protein
MALRFYDFEVLECSEEHKTKLVDSLESLVTKSYLRDMTVLDALNEQFKGCEGVVVLLKGDYNRLWKSEESVEE